MPYAEGHVSQMFESDRAERSTLFQENLALGERIALLEQENADLRERLAAVERPMFDLAEYIRMCAVADSLPPRLICEYGSCERSAVVVIENMDDAGEYYHTCEQHIGDYARYPSMIVPLPPATAYAEAVLRHAINMGLIDAEPKQA